MTSTYIKSFLFCQKFEKSLALYVDLLLLLLLLKATKIEPWSNTSKCNYYELVDDKDNTRFVIVLMHLIIIFLTCSYA